QGALSPCSLATIVAQGVAPGVQGTIAPPIVGALPLLVNNTTVAFSQPPAIPNNIFAPIWDVANINGQESMTIEIPCALSPGTDSNRADSMVVGVNNLGVEVTKATYASDLIAIYDVAFVVPLDTPSGDVPLAFAVNVGGTLVFANGSIIPVQ